MSGDWLDRVALAAEQGLTRREALRRVGLGALALGPLAAVLRAAPALADTPPPCRPACQQARLGAAKNSATHCLKALGLGFGTANVLAIGYSAGCGMALMYEIAETNGTCFEPNCGGPAPPAEPPAPPPPPRLPPPLEDTRKKERERTKNQRKRIKKRKKPAPKPDPCKDCISSGFTCCPSKAYGTRCCSCCDPSGDGCKALCG